VEVLLDEEPYLEFSAAGALSPSGRCRTFDEAADGFVPGEGCGLVLLKPLRRALADGDPIHGVIRGSAVNNDGRTMGLTTPNPAAQARVVEKALAVGGLSPREIGMVEAHGTATVIGDPMELRALTDVFEATTAETGFCAIGSIKSNLGHLFSAAGIAGLLKALLALQHDHIPPTLGCETPNPRFDFARSPFFPCRRATPWRRDSRLRAAGISAFGLGGTNAHVVVSEVEPEALQSAPPRREPLPAPRFHRRRCWLERAAAEGPEDPAPRSPAPKERRVASILKLDFTPREAAGHEPDSDEPGTPAARRAEA
jgi:acyl transferase domain-containing protein